MTEPVASSNPDFSRIEAIELSQRTEAYRQQLDQLSRALDNADEPLDQLQMPADDGAVDDSSEQPDA